ncbi:hypothetical protein CN223_19420 [Sinorhizobium meliloti]|nr:hypothetical protein CN224_20760 [Sinorhizobium meliloti]RVG76618.1 hypothetical protein CN223_19420 [Sinorhizobium meliloti]RVJ86215.1 hypothetical protein CN173_31565 [Sinorhizobium meliloti]RVK25213.1 hypothetical protein CN163_33405 [Sinorhizobium meliloti]RVP05480.1 hypothetical protein CN083_22790 [Sinorhizobium meliloti]
MSLWRSSISFLIFSALISMTTPFKQQTPRCGGACSVRDSPFRTEHDTPGCRTSMHNLLE